MNCCDDSVDRSKQFAIKLESVLDIVANKVLMLRREGQARAELKNSVNKKLCEVGENHYALQRINIPKPKYSTTAVKSELINMT